MYLILNYNVVDTQLYVVLRKGKSIKIRKEPQEIIEQNGTRRKTRLVQVKKENDPFDMFIVHPSSSPKNTPSYFLYLMSFTYCKTQTIRSIMSILRNDQTVITIYTFLSTSPHSFLTTTSFLEIYISTFILKCQLALVFDGERKIQNVF